MNSSLRVLLKKANDDDQIWAELFIFEDLASDGWCVIDGLRTAAFYRYLSGARDVIRNISNTKLNIFAIHDVYSIKYQIL